jgi:hypothetical protein
MCFYHLPSASSCHPQCFLTDHINVKTKILQMKKWFIFNHFKPYKVVVQQKQNKLAGGLGCAET